MAFRQTADTFQCQSQPDYSRNRTCKHPKRCRAASLFISVRLLISDSLASVAASRLFKIKDKKVFRAAQISFSTAPLRALYFIRQPNHVWILADTFFQSAASAQKILCFWRLLCSFSDFSIVKVLITCSGFLSLFDYGFIIHNKYHFVNKKMCILGTFLVNNS